MTFDDMVKAEPRLGALAADIRAIKDNPDEPYFCANEVWIREPTAFRGRLIALVGWHAEREDLSDSYFYDLAYDELYAMLPDCRDCACW